MARTRLQAAAEKDCLMGDPGGVVRPLRRERQFMPSTGTEISFVRFLGGRADLCRSRHSFLALLRQGSSLVRPIGELPDCGGHLQNHGPSYSDR